MLDTAFNAALNILKKSDAEDLQANAKVGLKVDFCSISSDFTSNMFMLSLSGTPFKIRPIPNYNKFRFLHELKIYFEQGMMSENDYQNEFRKIEKLYS